MPPQPRARLISGVRMVPECPSVRAAERLRRMQVRGNPASATRIAMRSLGDESGMNAFLRPMALVPSLALAAALVSSPPLPMRRACSSDFCRPRPPADRHRPCVALLSVGVVAAHARGLARRLIPFAMIAVMALGERLGALGVALPWAEISIALSMLLLGGLLVMDRSLPKPVGAALITAFALFHGYAHGEAAAQHGRGCLSPPACSPQASCCCGLAARRVLRSRAGGNANSTPRNEQGRGEPAFARPIHSNPVFSLPGFV